MIYKTWFGKHIDLSKIASITDAYTKSYAHLKDQKYVMFDINDQIATSHKIVNSQNVNMMQQKIDELVKVWKDFKESQQSCDQCKNYEI
jgi:hypothetical protein